MVRFLIGMLVGVLVAYVWAKEPLFSWFEAGSQNILTPLQTWVKEKNRPDWTISVKPLPWVSGSGLILSTPADFVPSLSKAFVSSPDSQPALAASELASDNAPSIDMARKQTSAIKGTDRIIEATIPVFASSIEDATRSYHSAWMPFRSETSATGFAKQLSNQMNRPFEVVRLGPGKYEVQFSFTEQADRDQVLSQIQDITGYDVARDPRADRTGAHES